MSTDPIKSLELLVESRGKAQCDNPNAWTKKALIKHHYASDAEFIFQAANFAATEAPHLLAIIKRQREALELAEKWLLNCVPIGNIDGPKPLPVIRAALANKEKE